MLNERTLECTAAVTIAVATVLTAWASYQAVLWGGDESRFYFEGSVNQVRAAELRGRALQQQSEHAALFVQYVQAHANRQTALETFLYQRFPVPLRRATDAWLATNPLIDPNAPKSPFEMREYQLPDTVEAGRADDSARKGFQSARMADAIGDAYTQLTVFFAMVLFFSGIAGKFTWDAINWAAVSLALVTLVGAGMRLAGMQVQ